MQESGLCSILAILLLYPQDDRVKRRERPASIKCGDITLLLPWIVVFACWLPTKSSDPLNATKFVTMFFYLPSIIKIGFGREQVSGHVEWL